MTESDFYKILNNVKREYSIMQTLYTDERGAIIRCLMDGTEKVVLICIAAVEQVSVQRTPPAERDRFCANAMIPYQKRMMKLYNVTGEKNVSQVEECIQKSSLSSSEGGFVYLFEEVEEIIVRQYGNGIVPIPPDPKSESGGWGWNPPEKVEQEKKHVSKTRFIITMVVIGILAAALTAVCFLVIPRIMDKRDANSSTPAAGADDITSHLSITPAEAEENVDEAEPEAPDAGVAGPFLLGIAVRRMPDRTIQYVGERPSSIGLTLTLLYADQSEKTIDDGFTLEPEKLDSAGEQDITVRYGTFEAHYLITVYDVEASSIEISSSPSKTAYFVGDKFEPKGLALKVAYNNGEIKTVSDGFECAPEQLTMAGEQEITVTYLEKTAVLRVTVAEPTLESLAVKSQPSKTKYTAGDQFDPSGLSLTATYNNGTTETISTGFDCSPKALNTAGTQTVTVTYNGKTATFKVTVAEPTLESLTVKSQPKKTKYTLGDAFDPAGMVLTATYSNGMTKTIGSEFECSPKTLNKEGAQTVTVKFGGKTVDIKVTVTEAVLDSITVKTNPTKTSYYVGDALDQKGLTLTATYSNGKTETVSSGFTCSPTTFSTAGTQAVTVTYNGKTTIFNVTVTSVALKSIAVKTNPTRTSYYVGDALDQKGLTLTATYSNGKTETVSSGFTCWPTTFSTAGTQGVTVTYYGMTTFFNVTVANIALNSIAVKTNPTKTSYYVGDALDQKGVTLTATYSNGRTETVSSGFTCSPTTFNKAGTQAVTVTYNGKTTVFNVTVENVVLKSIAVKTNPTKTNYTVGDALDASGLTLTATYSNGKTETVTTGFTCSPSSLAVAGTQTITVTYNGKTSTFSVYATSKEIYTNPHNHSYSYSSTGHGTHIAVCSVSGCDNPRYEENCTYVDGRCILCGWSEPTVIDDSGSEAAKPDPHVHNYSYYSKGNGKHLAICSASGCDEPQYEETCTYVNGKCKYCGAEKQASHVHDYSYYSTGLGTHIAICNVSGCDNPQFEENCTYVNGVCKYCGGS